MEQITTMGLPYLLAYRTSATHPDWKQPRTLEILLERGRNNEIVAAFTNTATATEKDGRTVEIPTVLPAEVLLMDRGLEFDRPDCPPIQLTVELLLGMVEHRLMLPYFQHQRLRQVIQFTTSPLFLAGVVDQEDFLASAVTLPRPLLQRLPELRQFSTEARINRIAWSKPVNVMWMLQCLHKALHEALGPFWQLRL